MVTETSRFSYPKPLSRSKISGSAEISSETYRIFQNFLSEQCGICLGDNKQYLITNRLASIRQNAGIQSLDELIRKLNSGRLNRPVVTQIIDAMTTNETFWFRDAAQFDELKKVVLPDLAKASFSTLRVWSAACSSGQEPFSISISVDEYNRANPTKVLSNVQIVGTDISESVLERAKSAEFSELELSRGLDTESRSRYFESNHRGWKLDRKISSRVRFQPFNLQKPFAALGQFEIIFCRNVLIYFSEDLKKDILTRIAGILKPGGYLFLSSTEAIPNNLGLFELVRGSSVPYYRRKR